MIALSLFVASFLAWFLSMLAGGGSPFILIPIISLLLGTQAVAPIITTGLLIGNAHRGWVFRDQVDWNVTVWYVPGATIGAILGSYGLTRIHPEGLQLLLGVGLLVVVVNYLLPGQENDFTIKAWYFLPLSLVNAIGSALIGSTGPVMNPLYFNYGLEKEAMVATKAFNKAVLHLVKLMAYAVFGNLSGEYLAYGLVIGLGAIPANWLGKQVLAKMSAQQFRQLVFAFVAVSGVAMIWQQRHFLTVWFM
ncbi:sulfite exporter TauE/SafE family protein [Nodosilinea sp. LEGE 07298]|uniref:sulfite exporter TauE/SafE family protein n=1 Tax=Nodosilinea sp. LEGE 07298 TaxID=2777970 RepID=UPI001881C989|nr:sulfite exporter TauE/SafE family protein [Nodosilinea sp. LEGE 07298]MBE9108438.1 sulfite exporter TauE/SafE family protein [Nodosilinea sp. LEGE 07298]